MILDATFLVDLLRRDRAAVARARALEAQGETLWVPAPAVYELWNGVERADRPMEEARKLESILRDYTVIELSAAAAATAGRIAGVLARRGTILHTVDALIAGIALEEGDAVLTRNTRDFQKIAELEIVVY
jgi:predicted nucleic acid-binding protein